MKFLKKNKLLLSILCNPESIDINKCEVARLHHLIKNFEISGVKIFILDKWYDDLKAFFKINTCEPPTKNIFISHAQELNIGFSSLNNKTLKADWWNLKRPFDVGYFHVCNGAQVIKGTSLEKRFKYWVSYNDMIPVAFGIEKIDKFWIEIFEQFIYKTLNAQNSEALKNGIKSVYYKNLEDLENVSNFNGKQFFISQLGQANSCIEINPN